MIDSGVPPVFTANIMIDKAKIQTALRSPGAKKYGLRFLIAFVLVGVLGFLVLPPIVKSVALDQLSKALHREVSVKSVSLNPYVLSATVEGLEIREREGAENFVSFDSLYLNIEASSLFRGGPVLKEIRLDNPKIRVVRQSENRYNFSDLLDEFLAKPKNDDPTPAFSLNNIQISGGSVELDDRVLEEKHALSDITLTVPFVSSMAYATEIFVEPLFSAQIDGAPLSIKGRSRPFDKSMESEVFLALDDWQLAKYLDYSPVQFPIKVLSGSLDTDLKLVFRQELDTPATLQLSGTAILKDLQVKQSSDVPLATLKRLELVIGSADLLGRKFAIDRVALEAPEITTRVGKDGTLNWLSLLPKTSAAAVKSEPSAPLEWSLGEVSVQGGNVNWIDESNAKPFKASVESIDVGVKNLLSSGKEKASFELGWKVKGGEWLNIDQFSIKDGQLDLAKREVMIGNAKASGVRGLMRRTADGRIEWIEPPTFRAVAKSQKDSASPWKLTVAKYVGENIALRFEDKAVSPAATQTIDAFGFELNNLSTDTSQTAKVKANFKFNSKGSVAVEGSLKPMPVDANLNVDVKTLELLPLQPYFSERLNIEVTKGLLTVNGNLQLRQPAVEKTAGASETAAAVPQLAGGFSGQATVGDFYAVDKINSADFLRWKSFYLGNIDVRLKPDSVSIGEVALTDFFARVIVSPEGKLNLMQIVRKDETEKPAATPVVPAATAVKSEEGKASAPVATAATAAQPAMPIKIGKITLQGGSVRFSDNFVKPNYTANLRKIGGRITGLSSEPGTVASLELRGNYDNIAPLNVTAKINPLSAKPYLDLQADVKGIEMTSFSPYSGKYAGYGIEKGKLSLFVNYKIENDQLQAENRVFIDQLTFGDAIESAEATKLPVRLAVSLLQNRNGEIDISLPISGSLNDPQFSIGGLVVKVIVNLIVKAVTSPFALLGSMFGGGEELSMIEFDAGRTVITSASEKRLENLAKALIDRPALKLEITGRVDPALDPDGLKRARIDRKVRALKREDLTKKNVETESAESLEVGATEYTALLERVYKAEKFPKPRNMVGMVKSLPVEEMEKLMLANSTVDEEDLRNLGDRRAKVVLDWLVAHGVPVERVFLLPGKIGEGEGESKPGGEQKAKTSRVDFSLK